MTLRSLKLITLFSSIALPALLLAQVSSSEEERLERLMADSAQWYVPKSRVSVGFRMLSAGGTVQYGNLGRVDSPVPNPAPPADGAVTRSYNDGVVGLDLVRVDEATSDTTTIPGRYLIYTDVTVDDKDAEGNVIGSHVESVLTNNFLSYVPGSTRVWGYADDSQVTAGGTGVAFHIYSATSEGAGAVKDTAGSAGVEFQYVRAFGKAGQRVEWGLAAGVALNGINNKTSGTVVSTLNTLTDTYSLNGNPAPAAPYSGPSFSDLLDANGILVNSLGLETTTTIGAVPISSTTNSVAGGVNVNGNWQVRGAYFMMRVGPSVRTQLTQRLGLSASIGVAGAYVGSTYSVVESFAVPNLEGEQITTPDPEQTSITKFLSGYYADLNIEWMASEKTGLFGGVSAQQFGDYNQTLNGRTAHVDLGSSVGLRGGVTIKF